MSELLHRSWDATLNSPSRTVFRQELRQRPCCAGGGSLYDVDLEQSRAALGYGWLRRLEGVV
jgi:hypothetical protein